MAQVGFGSTPFGAVLEWLESISADFGDLTWMTHWRALVAGHLGLFDEARELHRDATAQMRERGARTAEAMSAETLWEIEMAAGDPEAAERASRRGCESLEAIGERAWLSTQACELAESLHRLGRDDEASAWATRGLELGAHDDLVTQALGRLVLAGVSARAGDHARARTLSNDVFALLEPMQAPAIQGRAYIGLAEVEVQVGDTRGAAARLRSAAAVLEAKGATALLAQARRRLAELT
jgi:hypothetical protein